MSDIKIVPVTTKKGLRAFIQFYYDLYKGNKFAVPFLRLDEWNTLSKDKNPAFEFCDAQYFLAIDYSVPKVVGRVAAIINHRANEQWNKMQVRFGWLDFIDDMEVSCKLLDAVADWGREHKMEEMVGPLGFTDMDPEGMLTMGFDQLGTMATIYNYDYYPKHMERLGGFEKDNDYVEFKLFVPKTVPEKYAKVASLIEKRYNLHVKKLTKREIFEEGYGRRIFEIINETFAGLYGYSELTDRQIEQYIGMYFPMADLDLITLIEDWNADKKIVGVGITLPSLAKALQKCRRGRLTPFGWWHILRALKFGHTKIVDLLLVGILPEYRAKGANSLLFADLIPRYVERGYEWGETHVEMEANDKVQSQWQYLDCENHKRRRCYIKEIK